MHIIEEMILFPEPQPVQHIELDPQRVDHKSIILTNINNDYCPPAFCQFIFNVYSFHTQIHFQVIKTWKGLDLLERKLVTDIFFLQWPFH